MSYTATVFNIMIASPSDVPHERNSIREAIHRWNDLHAQHRNIILMPIGWETSISPEMGDHPQALINKRILSRCDLLVGVFWTRIGTETINHKSGTVEEIDEHISAGKPAMLYFSSQPAALDSVVPEQLAALNEFKKSCKDKGIYQSYDNQTEFRDKFYSDLQRTVNTHEIFGLKINSPYQADEHKPTFTLGNEATLLLKDAVQDVHGTIFYHHFIGGSGIEVNGKSLYQGNNRRELAKWEAGLKQLEENGLIVDRNGRGEMYQVTSAGYDNSEML